MSNNRLSQSGLVSSGEERATRASLVANSLRNRIMAGELEPDMQLRVQSLADHYAVALSPVREALNRLASEGLVTAHDMRGFFVSSVSEAELDELTRTRCWLNETALRQSMAEGGAAWEEQVLLSYHRLSRLPRRLPNGEVSGEWSEAHRTFHRAVTAGCRSEILVGYCDQLFVQAERYRNLSRQAPAASPVQRDDEHRIIVEAVLAREADRAVGLLNDHFIATARLCRSVLLGRKAPEAGRTTA
jgi:DNA-binding GntR family transcriptional regulator